MRNYRSSISLFFLSAALIALSLMLPACSSGTKEDKAEFTHLAPTPRAEILRILDRIEVRPDEEKINREKGRALASLVPRCRDVENQPGYKEYNSATWSKFRRRRTSGNCEDARARVLIAQSADSVEFTADSPLGKNCIVKSGEWIDYFSVGEPKVKKADDILVTPIVPVENAHLSGAWRWPDSVKYQYLNDTQDPGHLILMTRSQFSSRKGKGPESFMPENKEYQCEYLGRWLETKSKWGLCMTDSEESFVTQMRQTCIDGYKRDSYQHWTDDDDDCLDKRAETLIKDRIRGSKLEVEFKTRGCSVTAGEWYDWYSFDEETKKPPIINDPKKIDVDHIVPLSNAHLSGAWAWSKRKKQEYANKIDSALPHLIAVSQKENRSKGAKSPDQYMPENKSFQCKYIELWTRIKRKWDLSMSSTEKVFIGTELSRCLAN